ncbi:MAG: TOMM precursor leader peptide-binding protein [Candidatus Riflebacteria bacterium]|nr:TOMM precursor leader peptide-binding protein [Candidatus Riflebacteria bacterium]
MLQHPRFKPHLRVEVVEGEGVFVLSEGGQVVLQGRLYELVAPLLDGRPVPEICAALRSRVPPTHVFYTLEHLEKKGHLTESDDRFPRGQAALWTLLSIDPSAAARRLEETPVTVRAAGDVDPGPFHEVLRALGVLQDAQASQAKLTVVVADTYLRSELEAFNREALQSRRPWLLVKPVGYQVWIGPLFVPGETGCWTCLSDRIRSNSPMLGYLEERRGRTGAAAADLCQTPATLQIAWGMAATAVTTWIARGEHPEITGKILTLDVLSGQTRSHTLVKMPHCPVCSTAAAVAEPSMEPLALNSCTKTFTEDGGHRALTPQQTLDRFGHHVSPITGAVPMLERDGPDRDGVMHVYLAGHNAARHPRSWGGLKGDLRSMSCGKGTTDVQAKASALCEGLERYSSVFRGDEPRRRARLGDLGDAGIHPNACMLYSDKQYREREAWNVLGSRYDDVPVPFDPEAQVEWTALWSLTGQTVRYLPTSFCYFDYPQPCRQAFCWSCSNGNAAGNTLEEAILQGFLELAECRRWTWAASGNRIWRSSRPFCVVITGLSGRWT